MPTISQLSDIETKSTSKFIDVMLLIGNDEDFVNLPVRILHKLFDTFGEINHLTNQTEALIKKINLLLPNTITKFDWDTYDFIGEIHYRGINIYFNNSKIRKLKKILMSKDEVQPDRLIFINEDQLYFNAVKENIDPNSINFILLKSLFELSPDGGIVKYASIIKRMSILGIEKIGQKKPASEKMIRNCVDRLQKYKFEVKPVLKNARNQGVEFTNPPI